MMMSPWRPPKPGPYDDLRHPRTRFTLMRLWQMLWYDKTRLVEVLLGLFFFVFRGVFLVRLGYNFPVVEAFLRSVSLSETRLGWLCIIVGALHVYGAVTERHLFRTLVCVLALALALTVIGAFRVAQPVEMPIIVLWLSIVLFEVYLICRNYMAWKDGGNGAHTE